MILSKKVDKWVPKNRWIASLSNGETIYDDVRNKGKNKHLGPAWKRLGDYCKQNDLSVTCLRMQICGTEISLPAGQQGYFQKKQAWGMDCGTGGLRLCIGYVKDGLTLTHIVDTGGESRTIRPGDSGYRGDPGEPWTIYRKDMR